MTGTRTAADLERENVELRRLLAALESSEARQLADVPAGAAASLRTLFDNMAEGVAHCQMLFEGTQPVDFVYLDVNRAFETLTGLRGVVGKKVSDVIPGIQKSDPRLFEVYGRVASSGGPERLEIYLESLGAWFDISVYSPAKERFVAVFDVISERKKLERELELFRALIDQSSDTFEVLDPDTGRILDVNQNGCLELGYRREEYLALSVFDIDPLVTPAIFAGAVKQTRVDGSLTWEGLHRRKDGSTFPVEVKLRHVQFERGYLVAVVRNVSERHRAESERLKFMLGVARSSDAICMTTLDGTITYVNPAFEKLYGYAREEALGQTPRLLKSGAQGPEFYERLWKKLLANEVVRVELVNKAKDGTRVHVEATSNPILDDLGAPIGFLSIQRDITAQKQAARHHESLEAQLRVSQKMEAIGSLAGGIAHDFNNLLAVILSYVGFAIDGLPDGDPLREDLEEVKGAADRATVLTRQLLAFSRKQMLRSVPVDLNEIASGIERMLRRIIGEDVVLCLVLDPDLRLTLADPGQLEQVLMNLAVNARDAMAHGGTLTLQTANVELAGDEALRAGVEPGSWVRLTVTDTGSGMDEETRARLFEPFFTTKAVGRGTGLGLSTVYGIVTQTGGAITAASTPGFGTTFEIHLPRAPEGTATAAGPAPGPATVVGGTETLLLVEDDGGVRRLAERILRGAGYTVLTATNGNEALVLAEAYREKIGLVLSDVVMPQMGGAELAQRLKQVSPEVRVLFMSGYPADASGKRLVLEPGCELLAKPFTAVELAAKVRAVLDQRR